MYSSNVRLTCPHRFLYPLHSEFDNSFKLCDEIAEATCAEEVCEIAKKYNKYRNCTHPNKWEIDADTPNSTRLITTDGNGNITYLVAYKIQPKVTSPKIDNMSDEKLIMELIKRGYSVSKTNGKECTEQDLTFKEVYNNLKAAHPDWNNARLYMTTKSQFRK